MRWRRRPELRELVLSVSEQLLLPPLSSEHDVESSALPLGLSLLTLRRLLAPLARPLPPLTPFALLAFFALPSDAALLLGPRRTATAALLFPGLLDGMPLVLIPEGHFLSGTVRITLDSELGTLLLGQLSADEYVLLLSLVVLCCRIDPLQSSRGLGGAPLPALYCCPPRPLAGCCLFRPFGGPLLFATF